ncbi:MAG: hypothetical protein M3R38_17015 [Actinomycetota bacterium]|nr:hypothetical protein [Actinomycetota bacterium]MDP9485655.1 hypothetical protein [Actinomycetota bacterium]
MDELWKKNLVAVRWSGEDQAHPKQLFRQEHEKRAEKALHVISEEGAYVWVESPQRGSAKVGRVRPGELEGVDAILRDPPVPRLEDADHLKTTLKTLRLEDAEATAALNDTFDVISKQNNEQHRRKREEAERERERRVRSGLPLEDRCFFARLTSGMHVRDEGLFGLF